MGLIIENGLWATLGAGVSDSATTINLTTGHGARFGTIAAPDFMYVTLVQVVAPYATEHVLVTDRTSDALTVIRGQDGSTALAFSAGDRIECRPIGAAVRAAVLEPTGNVAMGGFKLTGLAAGATAGDSVRYEQLPDVTGFLAKNGSVTPTANLPMGGFKLTGLAAGSANGDSIRFEQIADFVKKDGTVAMTGNLPMGTNKITGLAAGSANGDAMRFEQVNGQFLPIGGGTLTGALNLTAGDVIVQNGYVYVTNPSNTGQVFVGAGSNRIYGESTFLQVGTLAAIPLNFTTNSINRLVVGATGVVGLTSGQLQFPATQIASADPNTLDDYEEGTFLPSVNFGGTNSGTYATQIGRYVKIGRLCYVTIVITMLTRGAPTGAAAITGLPFTVGDAYGLLTLRWGGTVAIVGMLPYALAVENANHCVLQMTEQANGFPQNMTEAQFGATNASVYLSGMYRTT